MQVCTERKRRKSRMRMWYLIALLTLVTGLLLKVNVEVRAQSGSETKLSETPLFKIVNSNARILDPDELKGSGERFGTATIKIDLKGDGSISAKLRLDVVRRGDEGFADSLIAIMRTWKYTPGISGPFYVTVAVPSAIEAREGKVAGISLDLSHVSLPEDKSVAISLQEKDIIKIVSQRGFSVIPTGAPPEVKAAFGKGRDFRLGGVFDNLGIVFQILFAVTFFAWLILVVLAISEMVKPWEKPKAKPKKWIFGRFAIPEKMFTSVSVKDVEARWTLAMKNTQMNSDLFSENGLRVKNLQDIAKKLPHKKSVAEIKVLLDEKTNIVEMLGVDFFQTQNGVDAPQLDETKSSIQERFKEKIHNEYASDEIKVNAQKVLDGLNDCKNEEDLRNLLVQNGFSKEADEMIKGQSSTGKTEGELRDEVLVIIKTLEAMQEDLRLNGNTNGNSGHSAQEAEPGKTAAVAIHHGHHSEEYYERFLWNYFGEPHINRALEICAGMEMKENSAKESKKFPLFDIFESGLRNHKINRNNWWASQEIDRSVDRTAAVRFEERRGALDGLWAIGSLSPMFGLGGTVWGISQAFGKISDVPDTRLLMQSLSGDINIALSTTIVGLVIGVLSIISYYFIKYFLDQQASQIEQYFTDLTNQA